MSNSNTEREAITSAFRNTPRGIGADNVADIPSAFKIVKFDCINENGAVFDLAPLVISFTITEELFSPVLVLNLKIRDTINFFEDFALSGQEQINIELERFAKKDNQRIVMKQSFFVKEYPNYQKTASEPNVQEYNIIAVSEFAYKSMFMSISRSVKGDPLNNIHKIFSEDLGLGQKSFKRTGEMRCASTFDGVITIQTPLKAVEWLRSKSFDEAGAPFFVYSTIEKDGINAASLTALCSQKNPVMRNYEYRQTFGNKPGTPDAYAENVTRILDMRSNIKLDKLKQSTEGAFASKTNVTDVSGKQFSSQIFDYTKDDKIGKNRLNNKTAPFSLLKKINFGPKTSGAKSLNMMSDASISNIAANTAANFGGDQNSTSGPVRDNIAKAKSFLANHDAISHQIQVYGDFSLNPGKKINIKIPKAVNMDSYGGEDDPDAFDKSLSGDYIIAVAAHTFSEGIYTAKLKIIKDA